MLYSPIAAQVLQKDWFVIQCRIKFLPFSGLHCDYAAYLSRKPHFSFLLHVHDICQVKKISIFPFFRTTKYSNKGNAILSPLILCIKQLHAIIKTLRKHPTTVIYSNQPWIKSIVFPVTLMKGLWTLFSRQTHD